MGAASQLEPSTFGIYQVRNRVLIPRYGRWAQKDPNASGMLHASLWHDGQSPSPDLAAGSLDAMLGDGANLFAFVGNNPFNATDPEGLFGFVSGIMTGLNLFDSMTDALDQAKTGVQIGTASISTVIGYQETLLDLIDWALDPTAAWDAFSYNTVQQTYSDTGFHALASGAKKKDRPVINMGLKNRKLHGNQFKHHNPAMARANQWSKNRNMTNVIFHQSWADPKTGMPIRDSKGRMKPDAQAFNKKTNTLHVYEHANSQSRKQVQIKRDRYQAWADQNGYTLKFESNVPLD